MTSNHLTKSKLQAEIESVLAGINNESLRVHENPIATSKNFHNAISKARATLGIDIKTFVQKGRNGTEISIDDVNLGKPLIEPEELKSILASKNFSICIDTALKDAQLSNIWREFIIAYVTAQPYDDENVQLSNVNISVQDIDDSSITIRINKGTRYEEFIKSWEVLTNYLGKGSRKTTVRKNAMRDLQMFHKFYFKGLTQKEIAKQYFNTDVEWSVDAVKKAIKRQKKLFDEGTKLAK